MASSAGVSSAGPSSPTQAPSSKPSISKPSVSSPVPSPAKGRATGDDILAAVDGEGVAPSLAKHEPAAPAQAIQPKKAKNDVSRLSPQEQRAAAAQEATDSVVSAQESDLESFFKSDTQESEPVGDVDAPEDGNPSDREQNRMQALANRTRASEERALAAEQGSQQLMQRFEQYQSQASEQMNRLAQQNAWLAGKLESFSRGQETEQLDPAERIEREIIGRASADARKQVDPQIKALQQKIEGMEKQSAQEKRRSAIDANKQRYVAESASAARDIVLRGLPEDAAQKLMSDAQDWVLSTAWGKNTSMAEAAKIVRERLRSISLEFVRASARGNQPSREQAQLAPKAPPRTRDAASGEAEPEFDDLRNSGYLGTNPFMDWEMDGRPALRARR